MEEAPAIYMLFSMLFLSIAIAVTSLTTYLVTYTSSLWICLLSVHLRLGPLYYLVNLSDVSGSSRRLREIAGISIYISPLYILWHYPLAIASWIE